MLEAHRVAGGGKGGRERAVPQEPRPGRGQVRAEDRARVRPAGCAAGEARGGGGRRAGSEGESAAGRARCPGGHADAGRHVPRCPDWCQPRSPSPPPLPGFPARSPRRLPSCSRLAPLSPCALTLSPCLRGSVRSGRADSAQTSVGPPLSSPNPGSPLGRPHPAQTPQPPPPPQPARGNPGGEGAAIAQQVPRGFRLGARRGAGRFNRGWNPKVKRPRPTKRRPGGEALGGAALRIPGRCGRQRGGHGPSRRRPARGEVPARPCLSVGRGGGGTGPQTWGRVDGRALWRAVLACLRVRARLQTRQ